MGRPASSVGGPGLRRAVLVVVLLAGTAATVYTKQSVRWESESFSTHKVLDTVYLPGHTALRMASLGYGSFFGDMMFIRTHAYYLTHMYSDRNLHWLDPYVDAVITLDPDNREVYFWAAQVVRYGQGIDEQVIARSNQFADQGLRRFPDDGRLYAHIGFNKYFELRPILVEQERKLQELIDRAADAETRDRLEHTLAGLRQRRWDTETEALQDYTIAASLPGSTVDPLFLVTLYLKNDDIEAASMLATSLYARATPDDQKQLLSRLESVGRGDVADRLRREAKKHDEEMPYVSPGLYRMLGSDDELRVPETWNTVGHVYDTVMSRERGGTAP